MSTPLTNLEPNATTAGLSTKPYTRWLSIGACLLVMLLGAYLYQAKVKDLHLFNLNSTKPTIGLAKPVALKAPLNAAVNPVPVQQEPAVDKQTQALAALTDKLTALSTALDNQQQIFQQEKQATEAHRNMLENKLNDLETQLAVLKAKLNAPPKPALVPAKQKNQAQAITAKPKTLVQAPKSKTTSLPFQLVSIDQWGAQTQAMLRFKGKLLPLTAGESLAGWQLESFAQAGQGAYFKTGEHRQFLTLEAGAE